MSGRFSSDRFCFLTKEEVSSRGHQLRERLKEEVMEFCKERRRYETVIQEGRRVNMLGKWCVMGGQHEGSTEVRGHEC